MSKTWVAIIIGMGLFCTLICPVQAAEKVNLPDAASFSARMEAGDLVKAKEWLEAGLPADFQGSRIGGGLQIGAWEGNFDLMRLFLAQGANINQVNANGESALALAAWKGNLEVVKWLLERGANINSGPRQWSALHYATFAGHRKIFDYLIAQGADINALSTNGSSPLMMAVYEGREDLARALVEKGANTAVKNDWGDGALEWAMRFGHLNVARVITTADQFNAAMNQPREKWGEGVRSASMSRHLEFLLSIREVIVARGNPVESIDRKIAAERMRILEQERKSQGLPPRAFTLEVSASRKNPGQESVKIVGAPAGQAKEFKVPPATFSGKPRMPPRGQVKNY